MALDPGSVSVDPTTGDVSGAGYARQLYDAEAATTPGVLLGALDDVFTSGGLPLDAYSADGLTEGRARLIAAREQVAAKCNALASALNAQTKTATVSTVVPSTPGTFVGVVT